MKKFICMILATLACLFLFACTPSSVEKAEDKMKKEGYTVLAYSDKEADGLVGGFTATKAEGILDVDNITALLFKTKDDAKKFMEEIDDNSKAIRDGKWVYWGTEDAIEDFTD